MSKKILAFQENNKTVADIGLKRQQLLLWDPQKQQKISKENKKPYLKKLKWRGWSRKFKNQAFSSSETGEEKRLEIEWDKGLMEWLKEAILGIEWELPKEKEEKDKVADDEWKYLQLQLGQEL